MWNVLPPSVLSATGMAPESSRSSHAMKRLPSPSHDSVGSQHALPNRSSCANVETSQVAPPSVLCARTMPAPRSRFENSTTLDGSVGSIAMAASDWLPPRRVMLTLGDARGARPGAAIAACEPSMSRPRPTTNTRFNLGSFGWGRDPAVYREYRATQAPSAAVLTG